MMLVVKCPHCGQNMKYQPRGTVKGKSKKCVYCGRSFTVHSSPKKSRIVREL